MSVKISQLPSATSVTSDDLVPIVDSGSLTTQKATAGQLLDFVTGSTFNTLTVTNLTASVSGTFIGDGSGLINLPINLDLPKLTATSSISLSANQRAVFANNSVNSSFSITLPSVGSADSREYYIIKSDSISGSIMISGSAPDLINGQTSYELNGPYQSVVLITDGANWFIF